MKVVIVLYIVIFLRVVVEAILTFSKPRNSNVGNAVLMQLLLLVLAGALFGLLRYLWSRFVGVARGK